MKQIVIMPGGFHPFHAGHMALYNSARQAFSNADLYVAATNSQEERPFPFSVKEKLAKVAGVEPGHFIQVKSPFQAKEITQHYNPDEDQLIFVRSEKDRNESPKPGGIKKDGTPAYFQPYTGKNMQPFGQHAYFAYLPTVKFGPGITSATEIRKAWPTLNDKRKTAMVMSLYPATQKNPKLAANVVGMLDQVMGGQKTVAEVDYGNHPSQRVDPRTGKKYVPPKSPLGQGVAEGSLEELANTSLKVKEPKDFVNTNDRKQVTYKVMKFKSGKDKYAINFTVQAPPTFGKKQNWNAVNVAFGVREDQDEYSFGDEINTDLTARNKNQFLIYSTVINAVRKFITEYNTEIDEIIMQGAGERQEVMYQRFFQSAGKYFPGWHYNGKHSLVRDVPRQTGKKVKEQGVAEGDQSLSVEQLAQISDKALDDAYHYGRSTPGASFGWMANLQSAKAAKRLIDAGETDIEKISDAIHQGWNVTAAADYKGQLQLDTPTPDEKKLKRAKLAMQSYAQLPEEEKEKDRVVARALLSALGGKVDEDFGIPLPGTYEQEHDMYQKQSGHHTRNLTTETNMSKNVDYLEEK